VVTTEASQLPEKNQTFEWGLEIDLCNRLDNETNQTEDNRLDNETNQTEDNRLNNETNQTEDFRQADFEVTEMVAVPNGIIQTAILRNKINNATCNQKSHYQYDFSF